MIDIAPVIGMDEDASAIAACGLTLAAKFQIDKRVTQGPAATVATDAMSVNNEGFIGIGCRAHYQSLNEIIVPRYAWFGHGL
jgi:hypothetical protein